MGRFRAWLMDAVPSGVAGMLAGGRMLRLPLLGLLVASTLLFKPRIGMPLLPAILFAVTFAAYFTTLFCSTMSSFLMGLYAANFGSPHKARIFFLEGLLATGIYLFAVRNIELLLGISGLPIWHFIARLLLGLAIVSLHFITRLSRHSVVPMAPRYLSEAGLDIYVTDGATLEKLNAD
jgi:hypothetical protein